MRNAVYTLLTDDQEIQVEKVFASPTLDTPKERRFIVLRWLEDTPDFGSLSTQDLQVWVHSRDADYYWINATLERVKKLMVETLHRQGSDGVLSQAKWTGDSSDARDDGFHTYTRYAGFRCNGGVTDA